MNDVAHNLACLYYQNKFYRQLLFCTVFGLSLMTYRALNPVSIKKKYVDLGKKGRKDGGKHGKKEGSNG